MQFAGHTSIQFTGVIVIVMIIIADPWHSPFLKDAQILWKSLEVYEVWNCKYMRIQPAQPRPLFPLFPEGWEGPQGSWDLDSTAGALNSGRLGLWAWHRRRRHGFLSFSQRNEIHRKKIWLPDALLSLWLVSCLYLYVTLNGLVGWCFFQEATPRWDWIDMKTSPRSWYQTSNQTCKPLHIIATAVLSVYVQDYTLVPSDDTRPLLCAPGMTPTGWAHGCTGVKNKIDRGLVQ